MGDQRRHWDELGRLDPYWAVLSDPAKRYGRWDVAEFLATGRSEIEEALHIAQQWKLPRHRGQALDFGCGVGRLSRALAEHFEHVTGVDVSTAMVERARLLNADVPSCDFHVLDRRGLSVFEGGSIDFAYSRITFQHIVKAGEADRHLRELVRVLSSGGLLVIQVPALLPWRRRVQWRPRLYSVLRGAGLSEEWLYRRAHLHPIRMRAIPEASVVATLVGAGASILDIERVTLPETGMQDRTYWVTKAR